MPKTFKGNKGDPMLVDVRLARGGKNHERRADTTRNKITQRAREGMGNGCVAQPAVYLFDATAGTFQPQGRVGCKP